MASSFAGIELGKRSLMAHTQAVNTAGHNISNAETEGYSRQSVQMSSVYPLYRPDLARAGTAGQIGQGVSVESINRVRDEMLDQRITEQSSEESYWAVRDKYSSMLEQIYNEPDDISVRSNMDKFWLSWQELANNPENQAARQAVVTRGETLTDSIQQRWKSLSGIGALLNGDIESTVQQVNSYTNQIADLNNEIVRARGMGDSPNDLLDKRDALVDKLSVLVNITSDRRDGDEFMIHLEGHILVQGSVARNFDIQSTTDNSGYSKLVWSDTGDDALIKGGALGALIGLRDADVREEIQSLNTMALNFSDCVNDVHRNAVGANNTSGLDFFVRQPFVTNVNGNYDRNGDGIMDHCYIFRFTGTNRLASQEQVGLEGIMTFSGKSGNINVPYHATDTVADVVNRINDSDGEVKAYLDRNSNLVLKATASSGMENPDFVIRHVEDSGLFLCGYAGILREAGPNGAFDFAQADAVQNLAGAQYAVSPIVNPSAYIDVNPEIKSDIMSVASALRGANGVASPGNGNAATEIAAIRNTPMMVGRERTLDDYFADTVTRSGLRGEQARDNVACQTAIMADLRTMRDSISGVNIDEELSNIMKFQHGYNAAAKFISVIDSLLDTVINRLGV